MSIVYKNSGYKIFSALNLIFLSLVTVLCVLPFIHILAISLSAPGPANANEVGLLPVGFNFKSYAYAIQDKVLVNSFITSVERVLAGVTINMLMTILVAYPLSREAKRFPGRDVYIWLFMVTMLFTGGLVPNYILVNKLKLMNSIWALVLPSAVPIFNILVLLNFFRQLPKEIEESAFIDGATYFKSLIKIYLPLSVPALATLVLFCFIGHWNAWFDGLMYMRDPNRYPLQTYMQTLVTKLRTVSSLEAAERMAKMSQRGLMMSYIFIIILPIMCVYPFLQKYIKTGLVLGSVKG